MLHPMDYPLLVFVASVLMFWASAWFGGWLHTKWGDVTERNREDFTFVLGGTLTLLGLIVGFSFSMAVNRYDQRKLYEEEEANAIGTEYARADLLPASDATKVRALLKSYLSRRILSYEWHRDEKLLELNEETARLQGDMWSAVVVPAVEKPTPVTALSVSGMNDVLNSQGYTQASWWNRIPAAAWAFLMLISIFCNVLVGYIAHGRSGALFLILPIALAISLFLIADIDSPHRGVIRVHPRNLESLAASLESH